MDHSKLSQPYVSDVETVRTAIMIMASMPESELFSAKLAGKKLRRDLYPNARIALREGLSAALGARSGSFAELCSKVEAMHRDVDFGFGTFGEDEDLRTSLLILTELVYGSWVNTFSER